MDDVAIYSNLHELTSYKADGATITAKCANSDNLCLLPDLTATLTIMPSPTGGGAAILSGDVRVFGVSTADIKYAQSTNGAWGTETSTAPSGSGSFRASITAGGVTASVEYGLRSITIMEPDDSKVAAPSIAAVGAVVPITAYLDTGYELILRPVRKSDNTDIEELSDEKHNKSFIMPDDDVIVYWSYERADYHVTLQVSHASSGVEIWTFTMPPQDTLIDIEMKETTSYTILYKAADTVKSILYRFNDGDVGFKMKSDTKIDDLVCWAGQMTGVRS